MTLYNEVQHQFTAPITAKGKQQKGDGYALTFDWKLPGSQYDFILYGRDWAEVEGWDYGKTPDVWIVRGNLKSGKEGQYSTDFFWNLKSLTQGTGVATPIPAASNGGADSPRGDLGTRIAWNSAINNAVQLVIADPKNEIFSEPFLASRIKSAAEIVYALIISGPPQQQAPDATEMPVRDERMAIGSQLERKSAKGSLAKLKQVNQARIDDTIDVDVLQNYVAGYFEERELRDLEDWELDKVLEAIIAGQVLPTVSQPTDEDYDDSVSLPF